MAIALRGERRARLARHGTCRQILISSNNAWIPEDYEAAGLSPSLTEGTWMAALVPGMTIVRAFSHIDWQYLAPKATTEPGIYAADDAAADKMVEELIADMDYTLTG